MVGLIVTGHGTFATGITSGLVLLAGELEHYEAVDFAPEDSIDALTDKMTAALGRLSGCDGILILADLAGGSPYNVSIRLKMSGDYGLEVIGGSNLPVVLDAYMSRAMIGDVSQLAHSSLEAGRAQLICFEEEALERDSDDEYEE